MRAQRVVLVAVRASPADAAVAALVLLDSFAVAVAFESRRRRSGEASVPASGEASVQASASAPSSRSRRGSSGASRGATPVRFLGGHHLEAFTAPLGDVRSVELGDGGGSVVRVGEGHVRESATATVRVRLELDRLHADAPLAKIHLERRLVHALIEDDEHATNSKRWRRSAEPEPGTRTGTGPVPRDVADRVAAAPRRRRGRAGR